MGLQLALLISGVLSARILGPQNRGYLAILATWASTVSQLGTVGISLAVTYYLASRRISGIEVVSLLRGSAGVQVMSATAVYAAIIFGYIFVSGAPIALAACLSLSWVPAVLALDYGIALALGGRHHGLASGLRAMPPTLGAIGLVWLYASGHGTLDTVAAVIAASSVLGGALALLAGLRVARALRVPTFLLEKASRRVTKGELLAFGRKGYLGYLSPTDTFRIDQLLVGFVLSPRTLGVYVVGAAFTNFTRVVAANVGLSATSEVANSDHPTDRQRVVKRTLLLSIVLITTINVALGLAVIVAIPLLFGREFASAIPVAELLLVAGWLLSVKRIVVDVLRGAGETQAGTRAEILNLVIFLVLCVPSALAFGGVGVAGSLAVASACGSAYLFRRMRQQGFFDSRTRRS